MMLWKKIRMLWKRRQFEADLAEEIRLHREAVGPAAFGSEALALEKAREVWGFGGWDSLRQDVRYAIRGWRKSPGFALTVVGTIGLALGLNTTLFSVFNAYVLRPLAVKDPYSLYAFSWTTRDGSGHRFTLAEYAALCEQKFALSSVIAFRGELISLNGEGALVQMVSENFFDDLQAPVILGRGLQAGDRGAVVLSHRVWQQRFGGDAGVLGAKVYVRGYPMTVVGVAAVTFQGLTDFPTGFWIPLADSTDVMRGADQPGPDRLSLVGRLRRDMAPEAAKAGLLSWARRITADLPEAKRPTGVLLEQHATAVPISPAGTLTLLPMFAAFGLVLLIACANVSNMMLARALSRQREMGIRVSLGAGRARLVRQLLTESVLLAIPAAGAGFVVCMATIRGAMWVMFATLPWEFARLIAVVDLSPDARVFGFILAASVAATLFFGLAPALQTTRTRLVEASRGDFSSDYRPARLRSVLVATQVTVCALLLICAAVVLRSEQRVTQTKTGLETHQVLDFTMAEKYRAPAVERLSREPLVEAIAVDWRTPLMGSVRRILVTPAGGREAAPVGYNFVSPEYFRVFGIPVRSGRLFAPSETGLVMVSESTARRLWPGGNALGQTFAIAPGPKERDPGVATARVIGIVGDVVDGFAADTKNITGIYFPTTAHVPGNDAVLVRVRGNAAVARRALEAALNDVGPNVADQINSMDDILAVMAYPFRVLFWVTGFLGGLALVLTATGIYGVMSYLVSQRTKEIGIRVALGASARDVVRMVMRQSLKLAAVGTALGAAFALAVAPVFAHHLTAVDPFEPIAYGSAIALVAAAAAAACYWPARKAVRVDPVTALRCD